MHRDTGCKMSVHQSDMKWKMQERVSLKAYLSNVHGQWSSVECCSHRCLILNPLSPIWQLAFTGLAFFFSKYLFCYASILRIHLVKKRKL